MKHQTWRSWGATVAGPRHVAQGMLNQDAWIARHYRLGDIVAVSDGVGSCIHASTGSRAACVAVAKAGQFCLRHSTFNSSELPSRIQSLWPALVSPLPPSDCSATCLFVIRSNDGVVRLGLLGDGLIAACRTDGEVNLLAENKEESFANITVGLGPACSTTDWRLMSVEDKDYCAFVLCTDGIADDLLPERMAAFAREVHVQYRGVQPRRLARDLRRWLDAWPVPGHADDKTIACLYRSED